MLLVKSFVAGKVVVGSCWSCSSRVFTVSCLLPLELTSIIPPHHQRLGIRADKGIFGEIPHFAYHTEVFTSR